jgi:hypothetical protein
VGGPRGALGWVAAVAATALVTDPQEYLSLGAYLLVAVVLSLLVATSERRRAQAERRERESRMLYELSASLVAHGSLTDTLRGVVGPVLTEPGMGYRFVVPEPPVAEPACGTLPPRNGM